MKGIKKALATAIATIITPTAFAVTESNVTLYGSLRAFADYVNGHKTGDAFKVNDGNSYIGFKGADKINAQNAIIWQIESSVNTDKASGSWASRNTFIGLESTGGTIRFGNFDSAYKRMDTSGPQAELFDNYGASVDPKGPLGFYGRANGFSRKALKNSINYETPDMGGFVLRLSYGTDLKAQAGGNSWIGGASGTFTVNGFSLGAGYQYAKNHLAFLTPAKITADDTQNILEVSNGQLFPIDNADAQRVSTWGDKKLNGAKTQAYKVAVNYKFDTGFNIGAAWERNEDRWNHTDNDFFYGGSVNPGTIKQDTYLVSVNVPNGSWLWQGAFGWAVKPRLSGFTKNDLSNAKMALLGTQYNLSKRSRLYGYLLWVSNGKNASFSSGYDALGYKNNAGKNTNGGAVSFGIRTDF